MESPQLQPVQGDDQNTEADVTSFQRWRMQSTAQRVSVFSSQCGLSVAMSGVKGNRQVRALRAQLLVPFQAVTARRVSNQQANAQGQLWPLRC